MGSSGFTQVRHNKLPDPKMLPGLSSLCWILVCYVGLQSILSFLRPFDIQSERLASLKVAIVAIKVGNGD